ncbi:cytochrome P450 [Mycena sp. CBHHK59/15]|nr:cytochrome P450 [Mycena sp. CBHHK59/15]
MSASPRELLVGLDWQVFHLQLSGYAKLLSGNFLPLFDLNSWDFHNEITQKYGGIVRIEGPLKYKMLYIFDPLALYHITVKDQPIYEPSNVALQLLIKHLNPMFTFVLPWTKKIGTPQFQRLVVDLTPWKMLHVFRDIVDVMDATVTEIYDEKKHVLDRGEEVADKDIMGIALVRTLHLLVQHPGTQEDLWQELIDATQNHEGDLLYDTLMALPHLDAVCHQMLQLFPPVPIVLCIYITREDVVLPLLHPIRAMDSTNMNAIHIPRVTDIMLSIYVANRNSGTWGADAVSWNPARWCALLPKAHVPGIYSHIHDVYSGFKFTQLEMKVVLSVLVTAFRFLLSDKEVMPLKLTLRDAA